MSDYIALGLEYATALWRRRWYALLVAVALAVGGWGYVISIPDTYRSSSRIYVDTSNVLRPLLSGLAVESNIEQQVDLMRRTLLSRPNLESVARMTDLDVTVTSEAAMETLIGSLRKRITIGNGRDNLFTVEFEDTDPVRARDVVQALTTIFVENNLGAKRTDLENATTFLDTQIAEYERQLAEAERRLAQFKQRNLDLLPGQQTYQARLAAARNALEAIEVQLQDAIAERDVLDRAIASVPETYQTEAGAGFGPPSDTDIRILELEAMLQDLRARYTEQHPDVVTAQRKLDALLERKRLEQEAAAGPGGGPGGMTDAAAAAPALGIPNPVFGQLQIEIIRSDSNIKALREQIARQRDVVANLEANVMHGPDVEAELTQLNRDYDVILSRYQELLSRREAARLSAEREMTGDKVAFRIVEPPQAPVYPSGPNRALLFAGVLMVSLGAGGGFAWLLVMLDDSFLSVRGLRRTYGIPVLGAVTLQRPSGRWVGRSLELTTFGCGLLMLGAACGTLLLVERQFGWGAVLAGKAGAGGATAVVNAIVRSLVGA